MKAGPDSARPQFLRCANAGLPKTLPSLTCFSAFCSRNFILCKGQDVHWQDFDFLDSRQADRHASCCAPATSALPPPFRCHRHLPIRLDMRKRTRQKRPSFPQSANSRADNSRSTAVLLPVSAAIPLASASLPPSLPFATPSYLRSVCADLIAIKRIGIGERQARSICGLRLARFAQGNVARLARTRRCINKEGILHRTFFA